MDDIKKLQELAGISTANPAMDLGDKCFSAAEKAEFMRKHNIKSGTPEWFKLWFSQPALTKENPYGGQNG